MLGAELEAGLLENPGNAESLEDGAVGFAISTLFWGETGTMGRRSPRAARGVDFLETGAFVVLLRFSREAGQACGSGRITHGWRSESSGGDTCEHSRR